tara:strand:+ start:1406 stop:2434 length:1029 start_codon:yes stop_codon:yes gene_type:complete
MNLNIRNIVNCFLLIVPFSLSLWQFYLITILYIKKIFLLNKIDLLFIILLIPLLTYKFFIYDLYEFFEFMRINYSFFIFYLVFKNVNLNIKHISIILILIHVSEIIAISLNFYDKTTLFGFSDTGFSLGEFKKGEGQDFMFRRPEGIFTNSTQSSVFYFIIFLMTDKKLLKYLLACCVITFFSGTGIIILVSTIFLDKKHLVIKLFGLIIFSIFSLFINKISLEYILYNINYKYELLLTNLKSMNTFNLITGLDKVSYATDFGFEFFLQGYGIYGTLTLLIFVLLNVSKKNNIYLFYILVGSIVHYPLISKALGALLFGYILSMKKEYNLRLNSKLRISEDP